MILIGQFDSPFTRRVAIAMRLYGLDFEHRPWSAFGDAEKLAVYNPVVRVPTLVLDDGEALIESTAILDYLDEIAGGGRPLIAPKGIARRQALKTMALACGLADKAISLVYERVLRSEASTVWVARCHRQIADVLQALEVDRAGRTGDYWFGADIGHADIAVACALRFLRDTSPELFDATRTPHLASHADRCEALPVFREISQAFVAPE
ncbi:glutathione S-transferase family protein [Breoghania sp. L-A4]|uniref:glutathione S-transferase family protein n=1 Tax=Breoghania sp. L-A4 TaxID=2304600 RepID=UPI000E35BC12|nr:glutathione S-transferase family protein [Breoghania sp. L-A4]AXS39182.1 glutathione S-transferase family protein [Breoghania sp. L-A4]